MATDDRRLAAIGAAAAAVLRKTPYHAVRAEDVAAAIRLPTDGSGARAGRRRSAVWLYNEVRSRRVLVGLAAYSAWLHYLDRSGWASPAQPHTLVEVRQAVESAITEVMRFHRSEQSLMTQVGHGIGDIATTEKHKDTSSAAPNWPDSAWGRVASDAWHSQCGVFASFLAPTLRLAANAVTLVAADKNERAARLLSDLAFRACLADLDGPIADTAEALAAFWVARELAGAAGGWVYELESAERILAATQRRGTDPRAEAAAHAALLRVLLEAGTLYARAAREGAGLVARLKSLTGWGDPKTSGTGAPARVDLETLCDAASRHALAALRFGDLNTAEAAWRLSREVADCGLGHEASRTTRAEGDLALVASMAGRPEEALRLIEKVFHTRTRLWQATPDREQGWRRRTLTQDAWAIISYRAGRVVQAVQIAVTMLDERIAALGKAENINIAEARMTLARALLSAGHPLEAWRHAEDAYRYRRERFIDTGFRVQDDVVLLSRIALTAGAPAEAVELLARAPARTPWFAEQVSFRLAHQAVLLHATALADLGELESSLALLAGHPVPGPAGSTIGAQDPLVADHHATLADCLLRAGDVAGAGKAIHETLLSLKRTADDLPRTARALVLAARCSDAAGEPEQAREWYRQALALGTENGLDPLHPTLLAARYDQAVRSAAGGDSAASADLIAPIVDRGLLEHGRPALGEGHPLLAAVRELARRMGPAPAAGVEGDVPWDAL